MEMYNQAKKNSSCCSKVASANIQRARNLWRIESPTKFYHDAIWMSPLIDKILCSGLVYDRNEHVHVPETAQGEEPLPSDKRTDESSDEASESSYEASESGSEIPVDCFFPEVDDYVEFMHTADAVSRRRGIEIDNFTGSFEMIPANPKIRTANWRRERVVLKFVPLDRAVVSAAAQLGRDEKKVRQQDHRTVGSFAINDEFDCMVMPQVLRQTSTFSVAPAVARLTLMELFSLAQQARDYLENVGFLPGRAGTDAGETGAQLVVPDLGCMERRDPSDLPFMMDAFAFGVAEEVAAASHVRDHET
ncbi:hypothetical protein HK405_004498 [Cladochytrium tenue]|nr:hypothetical protein HK405_004498 [Cladochytrium tenue]